MPTRTKVKLEDLSPEDREALLAEMREQEAELDSAAALEAATDRDLRIRELLLEYEVHLRGCPFKEQLGRVEADRAVRPANPEKAIPATAMTQLRCLECGGAYAVEGEPAEHGL